MLQTLIGLSFERPYLIIGLNLMILQNKNLRISVDFTAKICGLWVGLSQNLQKLQNLQIMGGLSQNLQKPQNPQISAKNLQIFSRSWVRIPKTTKSAKNPQILAKICGFLADFGSDS